MAGRDDTHDVPAPAPDDRGGRRSERESTDAWLASLRSDAASRESMRARAREAEEQQAEVARRRDAGARGTPERPGGAAGRTPGAAPAPRRAAPRRATPAPPRTPLPLEPPEIEVPPAPARPSAAQPPAARPRPRPQEPPAAPTPGAREAPGPAAGARSRRATGSRGTRAAGAPQAQPADAGGTGGPPRRPRGDDEAPARPGRPSRPRRGVPRPGRRAVLGSLLFLVVAGGATTAILDRRATRADERRVVERYAADWGRADFAGMHALLDDRTRARYPLETFTRRAREALATATVVRLRHEEPERDGDRLVLPVSADTRLFGTVSGTVSLPISGSGEAARITWSPGRSFPGLRPGERLTRSTRLPPRADLLARDGTPLAEGEARSSDVPNLAGQVVGEVGEPQPEDRTYLRSLGVPDGAAVGRSGLERLLNAELVGRPGGELRAGDRTLARAEPRRANDVRSSISLPVLRATVEAQAGGSASATGATVLDARTGEVLAFQGLAFSGLQPPGSTMKIVTAAAALTDGKARPTSRYPMQTETSILGATIQNADNESCGGTFVQSFAESCNSVFAPLGAEVGARDLVRTAERFGFNRTLVRGVPQSTIPQASEIGDRLAVASSAIGQGVVQANTLQVALLSATVARGGRLPEVTFLRTSRAAPTRRAVSGRVARQLEQAMLAVVRDGTGKAAAVDGVRTAGKTGTAELESTQGACDPAATDEQAEQACGSADRTDDTSAWMSAYAPADGGSPVAVGVLRERDGQGGATAAPVARAALRAAQEP